MEQSIRKAILERDHYTCLACGRQPASQVHHTVPVSLGGKDVPKNLVTLCGRCHMLISPVPPFALWKAFRIPENMLRVERDKVLLAITQHQEDEWIDA